MKRLCWIAVLCLLLSLLGAAQAGSKWGMSGEMHEFLRKSGDYNDFTDIRSGYDRKAGCFPFIAGNGEQNVLVVVRRTAEGELEHVGRYPAAVLQPSAGRKGECWLGDEGNGIHLTPMWSSQNEFVRLGWDEDDTVRAAENLLLREAKIGSMTFRLREDKQGYDVSDGATTVLWETGMMTASAFAWAMMPESVEEVLTLNRLYHSLGESGVFASRTTVNLDRSKRLAVYAAPSEDAWRGAEGKAVVGLGDEFDVLGQENGWYLVEYEITPAQRRVGYTRLPEDAGVDAPALEWGGSWVGLACDTAVTDDPNGVGGEIAVLKQGDRVWCYGTANAFWAYVEVNGGMARGFIPIRTIRTNDPVID